jgi:hypothetical protein
MGRLYLSRVATAHIKRAPGLNPMITVKPLEENKQTRRYELYLGYENDYLGSILFDADGYWIYDGNDLTVQESEDIARFIIYLS